MAMRKTKVKTRYGSVVQFVGRFIVAHPVSPIVCKPQIPRFRMPGESHRVAHAARKDLQLTSVGIHPHDRTKMLVVRPANVTGNTNRHVEFPIGCEPDIPPPVPPISREIVSYHNGRWRVGQPFLYIIEPYDAVDLRHVERAVLQRHTVGHVEIGCEKEHLIGPEITIDIAHGIDCAAPRAHEDSTAVAECERASSVYISSVNSDLEARRETDVIEIETGRYAEIDDSSK